MTTQYNNLKLYTVGHSNRDLGELLHLLTEAGIRNLVDVRAWPVSRRHPQFVRESLQTALAERGIGYRWAGRELGGMRRPRPGSPHQALEEPGFRGYADYMDTPVFGAAAERLLAEAAEAPTAILCAERRPEHCHRAFIADWLMLRGVEITHLLEPGESTSHVLTRQARLESGRLVYDRDTSGVLALDISHV